MTADGQGTFSGRAERMPRANGRRSRAAAVLGCVGGTTTAALAAPGAASAATAAASPRAPAAFEPRCSAALRLRTAGEGGAVAGNPRLVNGTCSGGAGGGAGGGINPFCLAMDRKVDECGALTLPTKIAIKSVSVRRPAAPSIFASAWRGRELERERKATLAAYTELARVAAGGGGSNASDARRGSGGSNASGAPRRESAASVCPGALGGNAKSDDAYGQSVTSDSRVASGVVVSQGSAVVGSGSSGWRVPPPFTGTGTVTAAGATRAVGSRAEALAAALAVSRVDLEAMQHSLTELAATPGGVRGYPPPDLMREVHHHFLKCCLGASRRLARAFLQRPPLWSLGGRAAALPGARVRELRDASSADDAAVRRLYSSGANLGVVLAALAAATSVVERVPDPGDALPPALHDASHGFSLAITVPGSSRDGLRHFARAVIDFQAKLAAVTQVLKPRAVGNGATDPPPDHCVWRSLWDIARLEPGNVLIFADAPFGTDVCELTTYAGQKVSAEALVAAIAEAVGLEAGRGLSDSSTSAISERRGGRIAFIAVNLGHAELVDLDERDRIFVSVIDHYLAMLDVNSAIYAVLRYIYRGISPAPALQDVEAQLPLEEKPPAAHGRPPQS